MLKTIAIPAAFALALMTSLPLSASPAWDYAGRVTDHSLTSLTVFDKEPVSVTIDQRTSIAPWIREKPFARKPVSLTPAALKFGGLVRLRLRAGTRIAETIEVANDVKTAFAGRITGADAESVSVFQDDMGTVTLRVTDDTTLAELITAKPFVRKPVSLTAADLQVGALVHLHNTPSEPHSAHLVEVATSERRREPQVADSRPLRTGDVHITVPVLAGGVVLAPGMYRLQHVEDGASHYVTFRQVMMPAGYRHGNTVVAKEAVAKVKCDVEPSARTKSTTISLRSASNGQQEVAELRIAGEGFRHLF